jgi:predicted acylesterase/phospholipase RssA
VRALVFSGGGTFCAYQAGVWRALEERAWRPDIVAGVSAGALNGWAAARGCPAARLQEWWLDPRADAFRWNWPPRGWGLFDRRLLETRLRDLDRDLGPAAGPARLLVTFAELPSTRIRVVAGREVTAAHLRASCAIPFLYGPVRVELAGRRVWAVDGGVFERLPLAAAIHAGATEIISVDVLAEAPSRLLRGLLNGIGRLREVLAPAASDDPSLPPGAHHLRLNPPHPLGALLDTVRWDRAQVARSIDAGYREAAARLDRTSTAQPTSPSKESAAPA